MITGLMDPHKCNRKRLTRDGRPFRRSRMPFRGSTRHTCCPSTRERPQVELAFRAAKRVEMPPAGAVHGITSLECD